MILCRDSLPCKKTWLTDFVYLENARSIFAQHLHLFSSSTEVQELQRQGWLSQDFLGFALEDRNCYVLGIAV